MIRNAFRNKYVYIFLLTYYGVWLIWDGIRLPFRDKEGIISYLPLLQYNPSSNILRFLVSILLPPIACLLFWLIADRSAQAKQKSRTRLLQIGSIILVTFCILLAFGMGIKQNSTDVKLNPPDAYGGPYSGALLDTFHEGETLGPAISYQNPTLKPYKDFVVIHGVFQDPLRTVIAFKLFGTSIGASRAFVVILGIATFLMLYALLLVIFRGNLIKAGIGLALMSLLLFPQTTLPFIGTYIYGTQFPFRDIATLAFLIVAIIGMRARIGDKTDQLKWMSVAIGFIVVAGFANSIDRAMYIAGLSVAWLLLVMTLKPRGFMKNSLLPYAFGLIAGIPILGLAIKWAFKDFFTYLFTMSRYKEYLDGMIMQQPKIPVGIILLCVAGGLTIFGAKIVTTLHSAGPSKSDTPALKLSAMRKVVAQLIKQHYVLILLFLTGVVFLRSAIGRALPDHFIYSIQWLYLTLVYVLIRHAYSLKVKLPTKVLFNYLGILLIVFSLGYYVIAVKKIDIKADAFPTSLKDSSVVRTDYLETASYLKHNLGPDESFITLTSEASWYYLVGKPSPINYPVIWYAFTHTERQKIAESITNNSKITYVITNNNWTSNFDYVPNPDRFPEIYSVLTKYYVPEAGFGQQTVWKRLPTEAKP